MISGIRVNIPASSEALITQNLVGHDVSPATNVLQNSSTNTVVFKTYLSKKAKH